MTILSGFDFPMEEELFFEEQGGALKRASMQEAARAALDRARPLVSPAIAYDRFPVSLIERHKAQVGDAVFHIGHHVDLLEPAREVFLALVTVGARLEAESREMQSAGKALDAYMLDAAGVFGVGLLIQKAHRIVEEEAARRGWGVGAELAPGQLSGWSIADQILVGRLLGVERIGVEVTGSGILIPQKSASLMVGLGPDYGSCEVHSPCEFCDVQDTCRFRH
jgi:hypothetical protein